MQRNGACHTFVLFGQTGGLSNKVAEVVVKTMKDDASARNVAVRVRFLNLIRVIACNLRQSKVKKEDEV